MNENEFGSHELIFKILSTLLFFKKKKNQKMLEDDEDFTFSSQFLLLNKGE